MIRRVLVRRSPNDQGTRAIPPHRTERPRHKRRLKATGAAGPEPLAVRAVRVGADEPRHFGSTLRRRSTAQQASPRASPCHRLRHPHSPIPVSARIPGWPRARDRFTYNVPPTGSRWWSTRETWLAISLPSQVPLVPVAGGLAPIQIWDHLRRWLAALTTCRSLPEHGPSSGTGARSSAG